jgi:hypothetical protein
MEEHHALGGSLRTGLDSPPPKTRTPPPGWMDSMLTSAFWLLTSILHPPSSL